MCNFKAFLAFALVGLGADTADACRMRLVEQHQLDAAEKQRDLAPPSEIGPVTVTVNRGKGPEFLADGSTLSSSCDDTGSVRLRFEPPSDDWTPPERMGYEIALVAGRSPALLPTGAVRAGFGNALFLYWTDDATDDQEPVEFTISITPVDLAGQRGPATVVFVKDPGSKLSR